MSQYRFFVKDCYDLSGRVKSDVVCLSFDVKRDLLEKGTSTFNLELVDTNVDVGDVAGLYDSYGTIYYIGVIDEIDRTSMQVVCTSNVSYFRYLWLYDPLRGETGKTETLLKREFENVFINSPDYLMRRKYSDINIVLLSNSLSYLLPLKDEKATSNFEDFLYELFESYGIICDLKIGFKPETPTLTIDASVVDQEPIKVGNNFNKIQNFSIDTDTFETNKLIVYSEDGTELRGTFYGTTAGITEDDESPLRLKKVNNSIAFSDDSIALVKAQHLRNEMYNHKISFDLILDNSFYNFFELFKLGCRVDVWYNGTYYNTIFTGYEFVKENDAEISKVHIICGKVRNSLTSKILKYVK